MFNGHRERGGVGRAGTRRDLTFRIAIFLIPCFCRRSRLARRRLCSAAITSCRCNTAFGIAINLGDTGNFITGDQSYFNGTAGLLDNNSNCGKNFWINNRFQTSAPGANAGCLK